MARRPFTDKPADPLEEYLCNLTRRRFFGSMASTMGAGLGMNALTGLMADGAQAAITTTDGAREILSNLPHYAPRPGGSSTCTWKVLPASWTSFDYKPVLKDRFDQDLPDSIRNGQRITTMTSGQERFPVAPSMFEFHRRENNEDGIMLSELLPYTGAIAHELCFIHSMHTPSINHEPGITFFQTGHEQPGRPCFGSWMSYGLGSESRDLPAFVVMITQGYGNMQALSARFWGSGFLPSEHQGCKLRAGKDSVLYLTDPDGVSREDRRRMLDLASKINEEEYEKSLDPEITARIAQYEMAYRMQMSVPELTDISKERPETLELYGEDVRTPGTFAANCLQARRLAERGVRFIQLYMRGWDQHGNLPGEIRAPVQGRRPGSGRPGSGSEAHVACLMRRWSSGQVNSDGRSIARAPPPKPTTEETIIQDASPSGWPVEASSPASVTARRTITHTT